MRRRPRTGALRTALVGTVPSVTQFGFPLLGGRERVLFLDDGLFPGVFQAPGFSGIEFDVCLEFGRHIRFLIDGFDGAFEFCGVSETKLSIH